MRRILALLRPETGAILVTLACAGVSQVLVLVEPQILRLIIDRYALQAGTLTTRAFVTGTGGLILLSVSLAFIARVCRNYQSYWSGVVALRASTRMYAAMVGESLRLPYGRFETIASAERVQRLQKARADVVRVLSHITVPFSAALALAVVVAYGFKVAWPLGVTLLLLPAVLAAVLLPVGTVIKRKQMQIADEMARSSAAAAEAFRNAEVIMSLGVEREEAGRLDAQAAHLLALEMQRLTLERRLKFIEGTIHNMSRTLVLLMALWLLREGRLSTGQLVTIFLYTLSIFAPLSHMADFAASLRESGASLDAAGGLPTEPAAAEAAGDPPPPIRELALEDVSFRYPGAASLALDRVNVRVPAGQVVALVGASGAGKSSIVKMLIGLYAPETGRVLVNGAPLDAGSAIRRRIGIVTQESQLFAGTLRENLRLARPEATDAECFEALRAASALGIVERGAHGLDLTIGEGGLGLSGGERQRIAIARALLRDPEVLIFDEATSMLDATCEAEVMDAICGLTTSGGRLTLTISHRASVAGRADYVYVLAAGRIADHGKPDALAARGGPYGTLWRDTLESV